MRRRKNLRDKTSSDLSVFVNALQRLHRLLIDSFEIAKDWLNQILLQIVLRKPKVSQDYFYQQQQTRQRKINKHMNK